MAKNDKALVGVSCILLGYVLLKNPKCSCGCKTVAQHLMSQGFDDLFAVVLA
jgi:hypothetical protein